MKNYFCVLNWVSNRDYIPCGGSESINVLVPLKDDWNQDFKIGERVLPSYDLLKKLHNACVQYIKDYIIKTSSLDLKMKDIFDIFERLDHQAYMSWFLSPSTDGQIPDYIINKRINPEYIEYKNKHLETIITSEEQYSNLEVFDVEVNSRIEISDIIYDFTDQRKIYILEMKPFTY